MKIVFSKEEVLDIVLQHVRREFPRAMVNAAEVEGYSSFNAVSVLHEPALEADPESLICAEVGY